MFASALTLDAEVVVEGDAIPVVVGSCQVPMDSQEDAHCKNGRSPHQIAMLQKTEGPMEALRSKMDGGNGIRVCDDAAAMG